MVATRRDQLERERQSLLTIRLCTAIAVLSAVLMWQIGDRYFGLGAAVEAVLNEPETTPPNSEADRNPTCNAAVASTTASTPLATECGPINSKIETPPTTKIVTGSKTKTL
jgi:hypothetical protein